MNIYFIRLMSRGSKVLQKQFLYHQNYVIQKFKPKIRVSLLDDDIFHWKAQIQGPQDTPYQGAMFDIQIMFPYQYPFFPPKMKFLTKIWHLNFSQTTGEIFINALMESNWTPVNNIQKLLVYIQSLLGSPQKRDESCNLGDNFKDKVHRSIQTFMNGLVEFDQYNQTARLEYNQDPKIFQQHARSWVKKYATPIQKKGEIMSNRLTVQEVFQPSNKIDKIILNKYMTYLKSILPS